MNHNLVIRPLYLSLPFVPERTLSKGGRGIAFWKNPDKIQALKHAFSLSANVSEACFYAGISRQQYYEYKKKNPDIVADWESHRHWLSLKAKYNITQAILVGDIEMSWRFLETHDENYKKACQHHVYH